MVAAGHSDADHQDLDRYIAKFIAATSWRPAIVHHAAGARLYMNHGVIGRWILGVVDRHRFDTSQNHEFTDWADLSRFVEEFRSAVRFVIRDGTHRRPLSAPA
jgi:menaquinone-dependent protoporphyrinogen oxidase